jgi:ankyrin repeat protein
MTIQALPDRPDLDQLRRQAKELRDAARRGDPAAIARIRRYFQPELPVTLARAQLALARDLGFPSWPKLKAEVDRRTMDRTERARAFLYASVTGEVPGDHTVGAHRAVELLRDDPGLAGHDLRTAAVLGEVDRVRAALAADPGVAIRPDSASGWPPLLFVCNSRWHRLDPARADGLVATAELLMEAGASPGAAVGQEALSGYCSALYAAAGLANNPGLARLLLDRGADPDTPSALYHTAFHPDHECLALLLGRGASAEGHDALAAAISVRDTGAVRLLLDAGVDPRVPLPPQALGESYAPEPPTGPVYAAIEFDGSPELVELLLQRGAASDAPGQTGWSPRQLAARRGRRDVAALLDRWGARDDSTDVDRFLAACTSADGDRARAMLAADPGLLERLTEADRGVLVDAAAAGATEAVALMHDLGFPLEVHSGPDGATALHAAAGVGAADVVQLLLDRGADLEAPDTTWHATPLCWATVGSGLGLGRVPGSDWVTTVETLIAAGAATENVWVEGKPPSAEVAAALGSHGIGPPEDPPADSAGRPPT